MNVGLLLSPAYFLENIGFHKPIENPILREIIPRIVALIVPVFYGLQMVVYFTIGVLDLSFALLRLSPGILGLYAMVHTAYSVTNGFSSFLEIPEKMIFGSHHCANYCGDQKRYIRKDLSEKIMLI